MPQPPMTLSEIVEVRESRRRFDKQVVGIAEAIIAVDCGAIHGGNWRLPCRRCIEREEALKATLLQAIADEGVRRAMERNLDKRDGNKRLKKQGSYAG